MSNGVDVQGQAEPPNTKLCALLAVFQDLFRKYPDFQFMDPIQVMGRIIEEDGNYQEHLRFIDSYIFDDGGVMPSLDGTRKGMAVMLIMGYMYAKGEAKTKGFLIR